MFYTDATGLQHESYDAACIYYGADTPAQCEAECAYWAQIEADADLDLRMTDALLPYVMQTPADECPF